MGWLRGWLGNLWNRSSVSRSSLVEDPDVVTLGSNSGGWSDTVDKVESRDWDVSHVLPSDITEGDDGELLVGGEAASEYDDVVVNFRPSSFFSNVEDHYKKADGDFESLEQYEAEMWNRIKRLETEYDLEFLGDTRGQHAMEMKGVTKRFYDNLGVDTTESYGLEGAYRKIRDGEKIIAKPQSKNQGEGVELLEPDKIDEDKRPEDLVDEYIEEALESDDYSIADVEEEIEFEEFIDTRLKGNTEKRMFFIDNKAFVSTKVHPENDDPEGEYNAQNTHNGGEYVEEVSPENWTKAEWGLYEAGRQMDGIHAIDYIDTQEDEAILLEDNANPGHGTFEAVDEDPTEYEADLIESRLDDEGTVYEPMSREEYMDDEAILEEYESQEAESIEELDSPVSMENTENTSNEGLTV